MSFCQDSRLSTSNFTESHKLSFWINYCFEFTLCIRKIVFFDLITLLEELRSELTKLFLFLIKKDLSFESDLIDGDGFLLNHFGDAEDGLSGTYGVSWSKTAWILKTDQAVLGFTIFIDAYVLDLMS